VGAADGGLSPAAFGPALAAAWEAAGVRRFWRLGLPDDGGTLLLGYGETAPDPDPVFPLAQLYAYGVGQALHNAVLRSQIQAQRLQLEAAEAVSEIAAALNSRLGEPDVLQLIADRAQDLLAADGAAINLLEADGRSVRTTVVSGGGMQALLGRVYPAESSIVAGVTITGEAAVWISNRAGGSEDLGISVSLVQPLTGPFGPIGSIGVLARAGSGRHFGPTDIRLLELFARQAALAITNARMIERSRLEAGFQATFNSIIEALLQAHSDDEVQASLVETAARLIPCESCTFAAYSGDLGTATVRHAWAAEGGRDLRGSASPQTDWPDLLPAILRGDLVYWTANGSDAPSDRSFRAAGLESLILVPVIYRGWLLGTLGFANIADMPNWLPLTPDLLRHLAAQAASALTTARLYEETRAHLAAVRRMSERLQALNNVSVQIQAARHPDEVYAQTFAGLRSLSLHAVVLGLDAPPGTLSVLAHSFTDRERSRVAGLHLPNFDVGGVPIVAAPEMMEAFHRREVQFIEDVRPLLATALGDRVTGMPDMVETLGEGLGARQAVIAPLIARDRLMGLLIILGTTLQPGDEAALAPLASQAAVALDKAFLYDAMQAANRFSGSLIDSMSEGLAVVDTEGRHVLANRAFCNMVGYTPDQLDGRLPPYAYWPEDDDEPQPADLIAGRLPGGHEVAVTLQRQDGSRFHAGISPAEVHDERGRVTGWMVMVRDLTERERLEAAAAAAHAAREADRLKSELLSTVSHELRTPLAAIKGFTSTLLRYGDRLTLDEQREFLGDIEASSDRLAELVGNLLNMGRLEASLLSMEQESLDLAPLLREETAGFLPRLAGQHQTLMLDIPDHLPPVEADPRRIRQVLSNLLDNAAKYTPAGGRVTVRAWDDGDSVVFLVADSGPGIPADHLERIFDPFHRVDSGLTRTVGGTGLGLAITRRILDAHHGTIGVESPPDGGTTFTVRLPVQLGAITAPA
jgi:PAS domain S-box-containing protein